MKSILKDWVIELGLRHQGVLISAARGCDNVPKDDPAKHLLRCYRDVMMNSFDNKPSSYIEKVDYTRQSWDHFNYNHYQVGIDQLYRRMDNVISDHDHYPIHFMLHIMHASEIIGYKHPNIQVREAWGYFYIKMCKKFHLTPESEEHLDERLLADEEKFKKLSK